MMAPSSMACHNKCNATSVFVTVTSIEVHTSGIDNVTGEWTAVCADKVPMTIDLAKLQSITQIICDASIKPQAITNVRLAVSSGNVTIGGVLMTLKVPSDKIGIHISPLANVEAGKTTTVVVQFQSDIHCPSNENGYCMLVPALHAMSEGPD